MPHGYQIVVDGEKYVYCVIGTVFRPVIHVWAILT